MNRLRILMVEDNASFRQMFRESLQTSFPSIAIDEVADGAKVFQKVDPFLPDIIFMDIHLPGENGLELTRKIKANYKDVTIAMLTSYESAEYREAAARCGADC